MYDAAAVLGVQPSSERSESRIQTCKYAAFVMAFSATPSSPSCKTKQEECKCQMGMFLLHILILSHSIEFELLSHLSLSHTEQNECISSGAPPGLFAAIPAVRQSSPNPWRQMVSQRCTVAQLKYLCFAAGILLALLHVCMHAHLTHVHHTALAISNACLGNTNSWSSWGTQYLKHLCCFNTSSFLFKLGNARRLALDEQRKSHNDLTMNAGAQ